MNLVFQRSLNFAMVLLIYVQITDLFRIPLLFGISLNVVASVTLVTTTAYLLINWWFLTKLLASLPGRLLLLLKIFLPLVLGMLHYLIGYSGLSDLVRPLLLSVMFFNLFAVTGVLLMKLRTSQIKGLVVSIALSVLGGLLLNYWYPELFFGLRLAVRGEAADLSTLEASDIARTGGFYLKSTAASTGLLMLFPTLVALYGKRVSAYFGLYILLAVLVFLTGSRSGVAIVFCLSVTLLIVMVRQIYRRHRFTRADSIRGGLVLLPFTALILTLAALTVGQFTKSSQLSVLTERVQTLFSSDKLSEDRSLSQRTGAQQLYLNFIARQPFLGYGTAYNKRLKREGELHYSSHNSYLEYSFAYGVPYTVLLLLLVIVTAWINHSVFTVGVLISPYAVFSVIILLLAFFASTLLDNRSLFFTLGVLLGGATKSRLSHLVSPHDN